MRRPVDHIISLAESINHALTGLLFYSFIQLRYRLPEILRLPRIGLYRLYRGLSGALELLYLLFCLPKTLCFRNRLTRLTLFALLFCLLSPVYLSAQEDTAQPSHAEEIVAPAYAEEQDIDMESLPHGGIEEKALLRTVPDSTVERFQQEKDFRYANDPSYWHSPKKRDDGSWLIRTYALLQSPLAKTILYLLLGALVLFILYQTLALNNLFIFSRSSKRKKDETDMPEELMADDLDKKFGNAVGNNDLRLAIRYLYLQTLQALGKKNLIQYNAKTTNQGYLQQMRSHPDASAFSSLTRAYEYIWYGEFEPSREQFDRIRDDFKRFNA